MANVATELHTHTKPPMFATLTDNCSHATYRECEQHSFSSLLPSLFAPGYIHSASTFIQARRGRELLCLSQTHTSHHIYMCVCA